MSDILSGPLGALLVIMVGLGMLLYYCAPKTYSILKAILTAFVEVRKEREKETKEQK